MIVTEHLASHLHSEISTPSKPAAAHAYSLSTRLSLRQTVAALVRIFASGVRCTKQYDHPGIPLEPTLLHAGQWVADIVYRPLETALLQAARAAGCRVLNGGYMAVHQAADTLRLVTRREPDVARMLRTFAGLVEQQPSLRRASVLGSNSS